MNDEVVRTNDDEVVPTTSPDDRATRDPTPLSPSNGPVGSVVLRSAACAPTSQVDCRNWVVPDSTSEAFGMLRGAAPVAELTVSKSGRALVRFTAPDRRTQIRQQRNDVRRASTLIKNPCDDNPILVRVRNRDGAAGPTIWTD